MPALAPPSTDERTLLLGFLDNQRQALKVAAYGLSDDAARTSAAASALTVGGLIKHLTDMERNWMSMTRGDQRDRGADAYLNSFRVGPDDTLTSLIADYDSAAQETAEVVRGCSLDDEVPVPKGVPWFPADVDAWSVRWVMVHLIEETARHSGHAVATALDARRHVSVTTANPPSRICRSEPTPYDDYLSGPSDRLNHSQTNRGENNRVCR